MKITKLIRKPLNIIGIDVKKYRPAVDPLRWLERYEIKTILDIGAHTGQFAKEIRGKLPQAKIYSFEPLKDCYQKLVQNMSGDKNFKAYNFALGDKESRQEINRSVSSPSSSLLSMGNLHEEMYPHTKGGSKEEIDVRRLDDVFKNFNLEKEILVKIDVQGYEDKVIVGGINVISQAKIALLEVSFQELYKGQALFDDIYDIMKKLGFRYQGRIQQRINPKTGEILYEDSIFIKS